MWVTLESLLLSLRKCADSWRRLRTVFPNPIDVNNIFSATLSQYNQFIILFSIKKKLSFAYRLVYKCGTKFLKISSIVFFFNNPGRWRHSAAVLYSVMKRMSDNVHISRNEGPSGSPQINEPSLLIKCWLKGAVDSAHSASSLWHAGHLKSCLGHFCPPGL